LATFRANEGGSKVWKEDPLPRLSC